MRVKILFISALVLSGVEDVSALQYPVPVANNIKTGYENGHWWMIVNVPTFIEGGTWGGTYAQYKYATMAYWGPSRDGDMNYRWRGLINVTMKKKDLERRHTLFTRLRNQTYDDYYTGKVSYPFDPSNLCVAFINFTYMPGTNVDAAPCGYAPPVPAQCNITTAEILLDHKTISQKDMAGSRVESSFNINCSRAGTIKFSLGNGKNTIPLGGGLSEIKINSLPLKSQIKVNYGNTTFKIESILKDVNPGSWQASTVLVFEPL